VREAGALIETGDGRISVELEGAETAELVVIATGGPGVGHDHYHSWFSRLLPELRVGYLDYIGCGHSDRLADAAGYTIERFAQDIEALRLHAGVETLSLVGVSFGGFPAVEYALSHPDRVRRLVLSNAHVGADGWQRTNIDGVNAELARLFPAEWRELLALRDRGVRSLDPGYQAIVGLVLEDLEWFDPPHRPRLTQAEPGRGFNQDVYEAVVGEDPE
jgi:proline iminopeptidase